ncbi:MAG TPA: protein kinase [Thermoanaerobaculia bacterium]|nr:protein kinase [Thermoanaerobaculia bacterium]
MTSREQGTVLDGKYEIVQRLTSGGMGEVYLVRHLHLQELRVVKILRQDLAADPVAQKRFVREARLATQIKHPNVAILYDFSRLPDGSFYMVWEHIQGQDVGDAIRRQGPFPVSAAIRLAIQALRGLEAIHSAGIIHRDIAPDNLMIMESSRKQAWLKIIDLGLAKNLGADAGRTTDSLEITKVGMFMGKLQYCSPEQASTASGESLDRRSDLYSFALVFYEMVTGMLPFVSESPHGFIFKRLSEDPLPMLGRNPKVEVPAELDRVVRRALERDRDKRLPDAISFIQALEGVEKGLSKVVTREVELPDLAMGRDTSASNRPTGRDPSALDRSPGRDPARSQQSVPRQRSSSELSKEERLDLLAQIERAAKRVTESSMELARVDGAIAAGRLDEAKKLVAQIETSSPRAPGLPRARERLAEALDEQRRRGSQLGQAPAGEVAPVESAPAAGRLAEARELVAKSEATHPQEAALERTEERVAEPDVTAADRLHRVAEAEQVLDRYLKRKQLALARLALETLLELSPRHPNRADYESWVELLATEVEQEKRVKVALDAGRAAIAQRDFKWARRELDMLSRHDLAGERGAELRRELEEAERGLRQGAEFEKRKRRLEELLAGRRVAEAERELEQLAALGIARVTLDSYRERLQEARAAAEQQGLTAPLEKRYRDSLHARDWFAAREAAQELAGKAPASPRSAAMFAEVERLESIHQRQQAVEQGVQQVDAFIAGGDSDKAELALRILLQMDPDNRHRRRLERQIKGLRRSGGRA